MLFLFYDVNKKHQIQNFIKIYYFKGINTLKIGSFNTGNTSVSSGG